MSQQGLVLTSFAIVLALMFNSSYGVEKIGDHDDKHYWTEKIALNSSASAAFCGGFGWELVTIDSEAEFTYLKPIVSNHTSTNVYWTSAISTDTFKWANGTGNVVDEIIYPYTVAHSTCIVFKGPALFAHPCNGALDLPGYPLCQMRNARFE